MVLAGSAWVVGTWSNITGGVRNTSNIHGFDIYYIYYICNILLKWSPGPWVALKVP